MTNYQAIRILISILATGGWALVAWETTNVPAEIGLAYRIAWAMGSVTVALSSFNWFLQIVVEIQKAKLEK